MASTSTHAPRAREPRRTEFKQLLFSYHIAWIEGWVIDLVLHNNEDLDDAADDVEVKFKGHFDYEDGHRS